MAINQKGMAMNQTVVQVAFELSDMQAAALAEFLERSTFADFQRRARNINEAHNMADAASRLRKTLAALSSRSRTSQLINRN